MRKAIAILIQATCMAVFAINVNAQTPPTPPADYSAPVSVNYIRTWDATAPEQNASSIMLRPVKDVKQTTQYVDGLGRPVQTVIKQGSLETTGGTSADLVSSIIYDAFGREVMKYLPFVANSFGSNPSTNDGLFKLNPFAQQNYFYSDNNSSSPIKGQGDQWYFSKTELESSPLNRQTKTYAPGNNWVGSGRGVEMKYWLNTLADDVKIWTVTNVANGWGTYKISGVYIAGTLFKNVLVDENGNQVIEFKDIDGKVVLKKVQLLPAVTDLGSGKDYTGWLCTYYIYDDLNNLRCVIQPKGVDVIIAANWLLTDAVILADQCFRYEYDKRNRMIRKKVPGAGEVYMVYDARDRLVMTQDANMRLSGQWLYTKYDNNLNRPIQTGLLTDKTTAFTTHLTNAYSSIAYYTATATAAEVLTETYYDDYKWVSSSGNYMSDTKYKDDEVGFLAASIIDPPYPQPIVQSNRIIGQVTGTKTKVLGTSVYLYTSIFYDDKGRILQTVSQNTTGGVTISSNQYSFSGLLLENYTTISNKVNNQKVGVPTTYNYDDLGRLLNVKKTINTDFIGSTAEKIIVQNTYDALGNLNSKTLAPGYNNKTGIETQKYDYNIRGWLLGMNREYITGANSGNYFGFDLGYDKNGSIGTYNPQYNGNISGTIWKSKGDLQNRKYDFNYDAVNRLMKADFTQLVSGTGSSALFDKSAGIDFSVKMGDGSNPLSAYDANGNILQMQQWGLKINASSQIDNLKYSYTTNTNRLKSVTDFKNDPLTTLGDFKTNSTHPQAAVKTALTAASTMAQFDAIIDYTYDVNGNLNADKNKNISAITYNYLNLPLLITIAGKGTIAYTYDAGGNKLKKTTTETSAVITYNNTKYTSSIITTTTYVAGFVYEAKTYGNATLAAALGYIDVLQFLPQEEGRVRFTPKGSPAFVFDYFIKDHLGNIRTVLTDEQQPAAIYQAGMEAANTGFETALFGTKISTTAKAKIAGFDQDANNKMVSRLNGATAESRVGPGVILKVMAGDKVKAKTFAWYQPTNIDNSTNQTLGNIAANLLLQLLPGIGSAGKGGVAAGVDNTTLQSGIEKFLTTQTPVPGRPKAYLNWVLLDGEQFKNVEGVSGAQPIEVINGTEGKKLVQANGGNDIEITRNGYLYVYVSNESKGNVDFDDIRIEHTAGPLLEESHYYAFGLQIPGISSKAIGFGGSENKYKYNKGSELQSKEFSDGSGLELYATNFRSLDPQLGRWWQIDPKASESESPYASMSNNPIRFNDPLGDTILDAKVRADKNWNKAYNTFLNSRAGKRFVKLYSPGGKYGATTVEFKIGAKQGGASGFTRAFEINRKDGTSTQLKTDKKYDGINKVAEGNSPDSYIKFEVTLREGDEFDNPLQQLDGAETILHETQHIRIDQQTLITDKAMNNPFYQHRDWMKPITSDWYKERAGFYMENRQLWQADYERQKAQGKVKDESEYIKNNVNDFFN